MQISRRHFVVQAPALLLAPGVLPQLVASPTAAASSDPKENLPVNTEQQIEVLQHKVAIRTVRYQFAWALDTKDWQLFESLFTPEIDVDLSAIGAPAKRMPVAELVGMFKYAFRTEGMRTQQIYSNFMIDVAGGTARCTSYLHGQHFTPGYPGGEEFQIRAAYEDRLLLQKDRWQINGTRLIIFFVTGNAAMVS